MKVPEAQFILRNLQRVERDADPEERLAFETHPTERERIERAFERSDTPLRYSPPELLESTNIDLVRDHLAFRRWLTHDMEWPRHFGQEIKRNITGPMWAYDPDAIEDESPVETPSPEKGVDRDDAS